jgi:hypothetical protein
MEKKTLSDACTESLDDAANQSVQRRNQIFPTPEGTWFGDWQNQVYVRTN